MHTSEVNIGERGVGLQALGYGPGTFRADVIPCTNAFNMWLD